MSAVDGEIYSSLEGRFWHTKHQPRWHRWQVGFHVIIHRWILYFLAFRGKSLVESRKTNYFEQIFNQFFFSTYCFSWDLSCQFSNWQAYNDTIMLHIQTQIQMKNGSKHDCAVWTIKTKCPSFYDTLIRLFTSCFSI